MPKGRQPLLTDETLIDSNTLAWVREKREIARRLLGDDRLRRIVERQLQLAEEGDRKAVEFVFTHLLSHPELRGLELHQHNYYGPAKAPTTARPGTPPKIQKMRQRAKAGLPLSAPGDSGAEAGDDEEEVEAREPLSLRDLAAERIEDVLEDPNGGT